MWIEIKTGKSVTIILINIHQVSPLHLIVIVMYLKKIERRTHSKISVIYDRFEVLLVVGRKWITFLLFFQKTLYIRERTAYFFLSVCVCCLFILCHKMFIVSYELELFLLLISKTQRLITLELLGQSHVLSMCPRKCIPCPVFTARSILRLQYISFL